MNVTKQTEKLKINLVRLKNRFENTAPPENRRDRDFFQMVKNETTPVYEALEKWEEAALILVKERRVNVHPQQITATRENMELILKHSYFIDSRRKRYMELYHSVIYVFDQIINELVQKTK